MSPWKGSGNRMWKWRREPRKRAKNSTDEVADGKRIGDGEYGKRNGGLSGTEKCVWWCGWV